MPKKEKVRGWSIKEVARWLEKRNLVKFVPLFIKNGVVGSDLADSNLSFLYQADVMVEDREQVLAEIYMLLHPVSAQLKCSNAVNYPRSIHPKDREKYEAALKVAKRPPCRTPADAVVVIGSRSRSPTSLSSSTTTLTVPTSIKQRSKSESGVDTADSSSAALTPPPSPGRKYLKRKSTPAVHDYLQRGVVHNGSLYDTLHDHKQVCLHCVRVQRAEVGSKFGFSYQTLPDNCLLVTNVRNCLALQVGDRILEVNGIMLPGHKGSPVDNVLAKSFALDIVVVRPMPMSPPSESTSCLSEHRNTKLQQQVVLGEVRWQSLRQLLTSLQHKSFDPLSLSGALVGVEDLDDVKTRVTLEMEVEEATRNCSELSARINDLQIQLQTKKEELRVVEKERDQAVDTLRRRLLKTCSLTQHIHRAGMRGHRGADDDDDDDDHDDDGGYLRPPRTVESSQDLHLLFFDHIQVSLSAMEQPHATKEDVLVVLRELTRATQRHAHLVDRLISLVSQRAPWMIDELHALQDASELPADVVVAASSSSSSSSASSSSAASSTTTNSTSITTTTTPTTITSSPSPVPSLSCSPREGDDERAIVV